MISDILNEGTIYADDKIRIQSADGNETYIADDFRQLGINILGKIFDKIELANKFCNAIPLYYDSAGLFWVFDLKERYWKIVDEIDIFNMIRGIAEQNIVSSKERTEIMNAIKQVARMNQPKELKKTMIQFRREIVDIETGDRFPSTKEWFSVNPLPWRLPNMETALKGTPTIDELFKSWVAECDVQKLYEIAAYCFLSDYPIERWVILFGAGSNGKSVYRQIVRKLLGDKNCSSTTLSLLTASRFETQKLYKKLLCEMGETNLAKLDDTEKIKRLVSGKDLIGVEWKNKGHLDFINYAKLLISTNNVPPTDDKTDGFYRKCLIIDFPNQFKEDKDILGSIPEWEFENLAEKCIGILNDLLKRKTFSNEGDYQKRREDYEAHSNPFMKFIELFIDSSDPNSWIPKWELTKMINQWMSESKYRTMSETSIGKNMREHGFSDGVKTILWNDVDNISGENKSVKAWYGVKWKK